MIIGLTGGSGTGKSSAARYIEQKGFLTVDFDRISREITQKDTPCLKEIVKIFSEEVLNEDKTLNRRRLGEIVFSDSEKLAILNSITHRYILKESERIVRENSRCNFLFDAPLLFEAGLEKQCDYVISVLADKETRICRIVARDSISRETAENRINSQHNDEYYMTKSDFCVMNNGSIEELQQQLDDIFRRIVNE